MDVIRSIIFFEVSCKRCGKQLLSTTFLKEYELKNQLSHKSYIILYNMGVVAA
jgi:hypothetical protein